MDAILRPVTALLISAGIILAANGLEGVLLPLRGAIEGFGAIEIGILGACYFGGLTLGCVIGPRIIMRVGHIRAFLLFAALATTAPLLEAMYPVAELWWVFRLATGICFAGIMNVVESWLTSVSSNSNRGRLMSVYAIINFGALIAGQQLINLGDPADFRLFSIAAILCAIAAAPLALTLSQTPAVPLQPRFRFRHLYEVSPAAVAGCLGAGLANGAFWSFSPVYALESGLPPSLIAGFVSLAVLGGAIAQWPAGHFSDRIDRRRILIGLCAGAAIVGVLLALATASGPLIQLPLAALYGVFALPIYWISFAHANDLAESDDAVNVSASLLLLFSTGAILGPVFGALLKEAFGHGSLFLYTALIHLLILSAILYRLRQRKADPDAQDRVAYDDLPISTTSAGYGRMMGKAHSGSEKSPDAQPSARSERNP